MEGKKNSLRRKLSVYLYSIDIDPVATLENQRQKQETNTSEESVNGRGESVGRLSPGSSDVCFLNVVMVASGRCSNVN
jgi:hypothetical protein